MVRLYRRTLDTGQQLGAFDESTTVTLIVPRDRNISMAGIGVSATIANAAGTTQSLTKRQLYSIFDSLTVNVNGGPGNLAGIEGGPYYDMVKYLLGRDPGVKVGGVNIDREGTIDIPATSSKVVEFMVPIYFRNDVNNELDVSSLLDARSLSSLDITFSTASGWKAANTNLTITGASSRSYLYLEEVYALPQELMARNKLNGYGQFFNVFYRQQRNLALQVPATGLAQSFDMLTGYIHQQISFSAYDASAADWSNNVVDRMQLKQQGTAIGDVEYFNSLFTDSERHDALVQSAQLANGMTMWDTSTALGGLDARALKQGDLKLYYNTGTTAATGDGLSIIYKSLMPASIQ
jgi:hypothetical protein